MSQRPNPLSLRDPWDLVAAGYAAEVEHVMRPIARKVVRFVDERAPGVLDGSAVVDIACGPGTLALELAPRVREVRALDFSEAMLAELRGEAERRGIRNVIASLGDGMALPYADAGFAAGFSLFGLMFFPERARGFAELHRVLAPGGVALVTSWAPLDLSPLMSLMFSALRATDPSLPPPTRNLTNLENPEVFVAELRGAGFVDVAVEPVEHLVTLGSAEELWAAITRSAAPCALMRKGVGEAEWARRSRLALEHLAAAFAQGPQTLGTTAYFGFGRRAG